MKKTVKKLSDGQGGGQWTHDDPHQIFDGPRYGTVKRAGGRRGASRNRDVVSALLSCATRRYEVFSWLSTSAGTV